MQNYLNHFAYHIHFELARVFCWSFWEFGVGFFG